MPYVEPATTPSPKRSRRRPMSLPEQATPSPKVTRLKFTEEDDQLLLQHVREAEEAGHQIRGMRIYERFAEKVRTAQKDTLSTNICLLLTLLASPSLRRILARAFC